MGPIPVGATIEPSLIEGGLGSWSLTVTVLCSAIRDGFGHESARKKVLTAITDSGLALDITEHSFRDYSPLHRVWEFTLEPRELSISGNPFEEAAAAFERLKETRATREREKRK